MRTAAWISSFLAAVGAALLPACDAVNLPKIKPGQTSADEVRARLGQPGFEFSNDDGSVTWEYSRQPNGTHCYMITIGRDQIVQKMEQVLTDVNFAAIRDGMSRDEVRRRLGAPASTVVFNNLGEEVWEWHVDGMPPIEETYFMVHFDLASGGVKKTSRRVAQKG
ncbi:MAG: hypothetical protein ACM3X0_15475 [Bacteroidota bacterium]